MPKKHKVLYLRLPPELVAKLETAAKSARTSTNKFTAKLLAKSMEVTK